MLATKIAAKSFTWRFTFDSSVRQHRRDIGRDVANLFRGQRRAELRHRVAALADDLHDQVGVRCGGEYLAAAVSAFASLAMAEHARGVVDDFARGGIGRAFGFA